MAASSPTSSNDPGDGEPASPERRCEACGADISHRRAGTKTCDDLCRKALSRGKRAAGAPAIIENDRPLEDVIADKASERHLAFAADVRPGVRDHLTQELEDLYVELRRARACAPLPEFKGKTASYDYDVRAAQKWRQPRRPRRRSAVTIRQLEAVAA